MECFKYTFVPSDCATLPVQKALVSTERKAAEQCIFELWMSYFYGAIFVHNVVHYVFYIIRLWKFNLDLP